MVERHSQRYFARPIGELREQARAELAAEWIAERDGITLAEAALEVQLERERLAAHRTRLIRVKQRSDSGLIEPGGELAA
jgi:predicted YcjX-like family ATPase